MRLRMDCQRRGRRVEKPLPLFPSSATMAVSVFDLFKIGIGPSSSHTVGPMRAAARFAERWLDEKGVLDRVARVQAELYGSLALTGRGHGTDKAVLLGFEGQHPDTVDPDHIPQTLERIRGNRQLRVLGRHPIAFDEKRDLIFNKRQKLPFHTNGMRFSAYDADGNELATRDYYSVGGGFVVNNDEAAEDRIVADTTAQPYAFSTGDEMLALCKQHDMTIAQLMMANESVWRSEEETRAGLLTIWKAMADCVARGLRSPGTLPGGLRVTRRAPAMLEDLRNQPEAALRDPLTILDKENASISGAEVGGQGEVGVACSMAAGGLTAALGGNVMQVENAAEIGMEHNLGLTCDPIGGLVQIPCIERNAMGSVKAINASRMALKSDGKHRVSLDKVIKTMRDTGRDMKDKYKETSRGGLAVNV